MEEKKPASLTGELSGNKKYEGKGNLPGVPGNSGTGAHGKQISPEEAAKEFEKLKEKLDDLKKKIIKKFNFVKFISVLPQQSLPFIAEDEGMPVEIEKTNPLLFYVCIPEEHYKDIATKIKPEILKMIKESGNNLWLMIKTEVDLWNYGLDSKYDLLDAVSASFPIHDNGFLGSLRVANIHKSLVLRKFEKYVASYVIGGSLVRGVAGKDSDVDTFVVIDDTDVKRMSGVELLEKLRGIIYDYIREANALAGVKNILNVQVYLLTDFWQSVKDATPVMFTFIRDGVPLYDRGTFLPWKRLLQMGKIKPSPEAVDMFMKSGDQTDTLVKRRLMDAMVDIYWGVLTPTQALMMLAGQAPPEPKIVVSEVKKILVDKEKLMSKKEIDFFGKIVGMYKDYEHAKLNEISGKEIDELRKQSDEYIKKMKELRKNLEIRMQEHSADKIHEEVFSLMKQIFGNKGQEELVRELEKELVKKGKIPGRMLAIAKEMTEVKKKMKSKKLTQGEAQRISRDASDLIKTLIEYAQRKDLISLEKSIVQITYGKEKDKKADIVLTDSGVFLSEIEGLRKIHGGKLMNAKREELEEALKSTKDKMKPKISSHDLEVLRKELGEFSIGI